MLGNCDTPISSSTTNQWPHQITLDDHKTFMASSSANKAMEKANQQDPLKCPRCDSSNTKFCYYNNYSLSQPRHFCKACKRYWTRGGTLRNVPVGGGCRKNKRPKRQPSSGGDGVSSAATTATATANPSVQPQIDLSTVTNRMHNPLLYSLPTNPLELNFPFSSFSSTRVSSGFDLHHQMNNLGIGFSSGLVGNEGMINNDYKNGFKPIQDHVITTSNSSSHFSSNSIFFGASNFASTSTMASLLASTFQQQKFETPKSIQGAPGLMPYEDHPEMQGGNGVNMGKEVKMEGENRPVWNPNPYPIEQTNSSDPSSLLWNTSNFSAFFDNSNMGSVPSLI